MNLKQENQDNGRSTKMENLLKGIRNQETITTKEIKREKVEYMQKYPPQLNGSKTDGKKTSNK